MIVRHRRIGNPQSLIGTAITIFFGTIFAVALGLIVLLGIHVALGLM